MKLRRVEFREEVYVGLPNMKRPSIIEAGQHGLELHINEDADAAPVGWVVVRTQDQILTVVPESNIRSANPIPRSKPEPEAEVKSDPEAEAKKTEAKKTEVEPKKAEPRR